MMTLPEYEKRIGDVSLRAFDKGGEALLDQVTACLAVASRHLARVREGQLSLVPGVQREIEASFDRAEALLSVDSLLPS